MYDPSAALKDLSWSALLAGWTDETLHVADVRDLALHHLARVSGPADVLSGLTDLASFQGNEPRQDAVASLTVLAAHEGIPPFFARRAWEVFRLQWALDHREDFIAPDEHEFHAPWSVLSGLSEVWEAVGCPADWPLINPFSRTLAEPSIDDVLVDAVVERLRTWIALQRKVLNMVDEWLASGQREWVDTWGESLLDQQGNFEQQREALWEELAIFRSLERTEDASRLWQAFDRYNRQMERKLRDRA